MAAQARPSGDGLHAGFSRRYPEVGEECIGPSLAFVPLRGTKDCTQDDSGMEDGRLARPAGRDARPPLLKTRVSYSHFRNLLLFGTRSILEEPMIRS